MRQSRIKQIRAHFVLVFLTIVAACQADFQVPQVTPQEVGFYVGGNETRTEMLQNGLSAVWSAGDELALWARNSSGNFALSKQIFKTYGIDGKLGYFTSTLPQAMDAGTYTYYSTYPVPESVNGTKATFNLPSVQDGKVSGGADIMIAEPVSHGPLTAVPEPEDHSGMSMQMHRMMHQFRFYVPQDDNSLGQDKIETIVLDFPKPVVGDITLDFTDTSFPPVLSNSSNQVTLELADPISVSKNASKEYACVAIVPTSFESGQIMNLKAYTADRLLLFNPIDLKGRNFQSGHSTEVRLTPMASDEYYRLTMNVSDNHIGEPLINVTIAFNGSPWYSYTPSAAEGEGNFSHSVEALNDDGKAAYDLIINSIKNGVATYIYETEHALVNRKLTADMLSYDGHKIVLELGDVPYLLEEDFSNAKQTAHDDDYNPGYNDDRNLQGYLLNDFMPDDGWNAARFSIIEGDNIRINCRYQSGTWVVGRYCGRLDTPALKYLKSGVKVDVVVEFDESFSIPTGLSVDDGAYKSARYKVGYHTKSESSAIKSVTSNNVNSNSTIVGTFGPYGNQVNMVHEAVTIPSAESSTRVVFYADTAYEKKTVASNLVYYLYLDNIKVYIKSN